MTAFLVFAASFASAAPAAAYVRTRTDTTHVPLYWSFPRATLELARPPESFPVSAIDFQAAAAQAANAWTFTPLECSSVNLTIAPDLVDDQTVAYDGHNRIVIRTGAWCRDPDALTHCHESSQIAVTTVVSRYHPGAYDDGQILEADIEVNDVDYLWAVIPEGEFAGRDFANSYDLAAALTHEMGHFIGFAHTCLLPGEDPRVDDQGVPSPPCTEVAPNTSSLIRDSAMYPFMEPVETRERWLSTDDLVGACAIYSVATVPQEGMCQVGRTDVANDFANLVGALALVSGLLTRQKRGNKSVACAATLRKDS